MWDEEEVAAIALLFGVVLRVSSCDRAMSDMFSRQNYLSDSN